MVGTADSRTAESVELRIVTWNCNMKFHAKLADLESLRPDIAIIPECAHPSVLQQRSPLFVPPSVAWIGDNPQKGLGVFAFGDYQIEQLPVRDERLKWVLPLSITGPVNFNLLGIWILPDETRSPIRPISAALQVYADLLKSDTVVAGDFNHNVQWDTASHPNHHADTVSELTALRLVSAFHESRGVPQGNESEPTYFWYRHTDKPYHIDYCFVPEGWTIVEHSIGAPERWLQLSDHLPLVTRCLVTRHDTNSSGS